MNKICVYAITKNESKFVDRWYESMKEADEVVVLDTGSTDDTVEKLKAHGVKVEIKTYDPWRFDIPRNDAMKLASEDCNILISTDLDEILQPGWAKVLRENWVEGVHTRAQYKYIWSHTDTGAPGRIFRYNKIHTREWQWKYPVHELLASTKTGSENYPYTEELNLFDFITLEHFPDQTKSRGSYLPLLELREQENPEDMYGLIYLAHEYNYRGQYQNSINKLNKTLTKFDKELGLTEKASCYLFMGDDYKALNDLENAEISYKKAIEVENSYLEPYLALGKIYLDKKLYHLTIGYIKTGLAKSYRHFTWLERDTSWSYEPYDTLSLAYYYSGDKIKSLACAIKALSYCPEDKRLKDNVDIIIEKTEKELY